MICDETAVQFIYLLLKGGMCNYLSTVVFRVRRINTSKM